MNVMNNESNANQEYLDKFKKNGYVAVPNVFTSEEMIELGKIAIQCCKEEIKGGNLILKGFTRNGIDGNDNDDNSSDKSKKNEVDISLYDDGNLPRKLDTPLLKHEKFQTFALGRKLRSLATCFLKEKAMCAVDQVFMKAPSGSAKPYHQDNFYFGLKNSDCVLTCWIALDDADVNNGCMKYIAGSHVDGIVQHVCPDESKPYNLDAPLDYVLKKGGGDNMPNESFCEIKQGGVIFHHGATLHGSGKNTTDNWRRGYAVHFIASSASFHSEKDELQRTGYCFQTWYDKLVEKIDGCDDKN